MNTTAQINLNDSSLRPTETDVTMFIYKSGTSELLQTLTHTLNRYKNPDTLVLDPSISYDINIATLPPILKKGIEIVKHTHNKIQIDAPQGFIKLTSSRSPFNVNYPMRVTQKGSQKTINHQYLNSREKYLTGNYHLEIFTLPRTYKEVTVSDKKTTIVDVPAGGTLNLRLKSPATGQLFIENKKLLITHR